MPENLRNIGVWEYMFFGNSVLDMAVAGAMFAGLLMLFGVFQRVLLRRLQKLAERTETDIDDALVKIVRSVRPPFYSFLAVYLALRTLSVNAFLERIIALVLMIWVVYQVIQALQILIDYVARKFFDKDRNGEADAAVSLLSRMMQGLLWVFGALFILQNFGVNVTSVIAGLGIGGIAIAFALQNILGDLFSSFAIHFDKPFVVGDYIVLGDKKGTVERIGIKTTRIRAIQGEELVVSNQELTSAQVQNFGKMKERRIQFAFGVTYDTPPAKLRDIPGTVERIIDAIDKARFGRCFFKNFGDSALEYDVVYYIESSEYMDYAHANEEIFIKLLEAFEEQGIGMAFPTRTIHIVQS